MNKQALQKARASLLVLIRNNVGGLAWKLSKDPETLGKIIQEYESKGGDRYDVVKSVNIGLNKTYSFSGEGGGGGLGGIGGGGGGGEITAIAALTGAAMSLGSSASTLICGLSKQCRKHKEKLAEMEARSQMELAKAQQAQALALASQQQRQGGSKLPLIIGISLGVIVLIVVTIILIKKR